jgi:succinyl-diaminopimelate desuccinylase
LPHGAQLILGSDEERGYGDLTLYRQAHALPPYVFTPDANFPVGNVEKGRYVQNFSATFPEEHPLPRLVSIHGGTTANIVPDYARAVVEGIAAADIERLRRGYSEKTGVWITASADGDRAAISALGVAGHASRPQLGNNAQTALLSMLSDMPLAPGEGASVIRGLAKLFPHGDMYGRALGIDMSDELSGELTLNFGVLELTPTGMSCSFDSRTPRVADDCDIVGVTRAALENAGITPGESTRTLCHHTPADSKFVKALLEIYELYTGQKGAPLALGGSTYVHGIPGGVSFGCEFPGTDNRIHGANEFIGTDQLATSAKMFTKVILEMCG